MLRMHPAVKVLEVSLQRYVDAVMVSRAGKATHFPKVHEIVIEDQGLKAWWPYFGQSMDPRFDDLCSFVYPLCRLSMRLGFIFP